MSVLRHARTASGSNSYTVHHIWRQSIVKGSRAFPRTAVQHFDMAYNHSEIESFQHENKLTLFIDEATCCASYSKANLGNGLVKIAYTESCALLQECCLSKSDHSS